MLSKNNFQLLKNSLKKLFHNMMKRMMTTVILSPHFFRRQNISLNLIIVIKVCLHCECFCVTIFFPVPKPRICYTFLSLKSVKKKEVLIEQVK